MVKKSITSSLFIYTKTKQTKPNQMAHSIKSWQLETMFGIFAIVSLALICYASCTSSLSWLQEGLVSSSGASTGSSSGSSTTGSSTPSAFSKLVNGEPVPVQKLPPSSK